jgi:GTP pyrophosphokinase
MHERAEYGVAAHWTYKEDGKGQPDFEDVKLKWLKTLLDEESEMDSQDFAASLRDELIDEEVYVFTPKGEVKRLSVGATPLDFAYEVHTDVGHRTVGAKVNDKMVPLTYQLQSGDIVEVLTSKRDRGPSRDWLGVVKTSRARNKIKHWFKQESRVDSEHTGRELLQEHLKKAGLPAQKISGSQLLADVIREMGFRKAEEFYIALGAGKVSAKTVTNKVMQRLKQGEAAVEEPSGVEALLPRRQSSPAKATRSSSQYGIKVEGNHDVPLRLAKCCLPVSGDGIVGYVSLGRGITIHRNDCPNAIALRKDPERFVGVDWEGDNETSFKVELQVDGWDRHRMLEDLSRCFSEAGINILEARCTVAHPMVRNRFVVEVPEAQTLKNVVGRLRQIESVFDAYRVTPSGG